MKKWRIGLENAQAQIFVRNLFETPPNLMTSPKFAHSVVNICKTNVNVTLRGERCIMNHNAVLENTKGSALGPILVEVCYYGCDHSSQTHAPSPTNVRTPFAKKSTVTYLLCLIHSSLLTGSSLLKLVG